MHLAMPIMAQSSPPLVQSLIFEELGVPINTFTTDGPGGAYRAFCDATSGNLVTGNWGYSTGFKSRHPGGANFVFADGSVHFLSQNINMDQYQLLGCRNDNHVVEVP